MKTEKISKISPTFFVFYSLRKTETIKTVSRARLQSLSPRVSTPTDTDDNKRSISSLLFLIFSRAMSVGDFYTLLLRDRLGVVVALLFCCVFMRESESERILLQKLFERDFLSARNCEIHLNFPVGPLWSAGIMC